MLGNQATSSAIYPVQEQKTIPPEGLCRGRYERIAYLAVEAQSASFDKPQILCKLRVVDMPTKAQKGDKARSGTEEYFKVWIFGEEDLERTLSGRGESIMVYDPSKEDALAYWVRENIETNEDTVVPAGHVVRVIKAWVKFI